MNTHGLYWLIDRWLCHKMCRIIFSRTVMKMFMKTLLPIFVLLFCITGCQSAKNDDSGDVDLDALTVNTIVPKGKHIIIKEAFVDMEGAFISIDNKRNLLYMRNGEWGDEDEPYFVAYSLKERKVISKFGHRGNGPNEFLYPSLILSNNSESPGSIFDRSTGKIFTLDKNYNQTYTGKYKKEEVLYNSVHFYYFSDNLLFTLKNHSKNGWYIYRETEQDSELLYDLSLLPDVSFFYAYDGELGFNLKKNRMIYAYKFFREIHLLDLDGNLIRKIVGKDKNRNRSNDVDEWLDNPDTPVYYAGSAGTENYFYVGYREESVLFGPVKNYTLLEQYDWDGNLIRRIKLNKPYGSFCVDEEDKNLYLLTSNEDDPLYVFDLTK